MSVSDKRLARERLHMLVIEDDHANSMSRQSLLNAYRLKMELQSQEEEHRDTTTHCLIRTMDPIIIPPARKFEHRPGARITPNTYKHPLSESPSKSSINASPGKVHLRLSALESFPAVYKNKFDGNVTTISGDYIDDPKKTISLLKSTSNAALTIPGRAADFKTEVQWRLQLRNHNS